MGKDFKNRMLELLNEDKDVINAVKNIILLTDSLPEYEQDDDYRMEIHIEELKQKYTDSIVKKEMLEKEVFELRRQLIEKNEEINNILRDKNQHISALEKELQESVKIRSVVMNEAEIIKSRYSNLEKIFNLYLGLGEDIIKNLERILNNSSEPNNSIEEFFAYGIQENNIIALWEIIATNVEFYESKKKTQDLIDIFMYFLTMYKRITYKSVEINCPKIGETYDERVHTRTSASSAVGIIQRVILPGFKIGKNICKKSLVIVK